VQAISHIFDLGLGAIQKHDNETILLDIAYIVVDPPFGPDLRKQ
jgi:hypothetical protein